MENWQEQRAWHRTQPTIKRSKMRRDKSRVATFLDEEPEHNLILANREERAEASVQVGIVDTA